MSMFIENFKTCQIGPPYPILFCYSTINKLDWSKGVFLSGCFFIVMGLYSLCKFIGVLNKPDIKKMGNLHKINCSFSYFTQKLCFLQKLTKSPKKFARVLPNIPATLQTSAKDLFKSIKGYTNNNFNNNIRHIII